MNCEHVRKVLDAYLDGELDATSNGQLATHLGACPVCRALHQERGALSSALQQLPRHDLPQALDRTLRKAIDSAGLAGGRGLSAKPRRWWATWPSLAMAGASAVIAFGVGLWVAAPARLDDRSEAVIGQHVASLRQGATLVTVASSDRHTVKPWFAGRVDFAPPVRDLQPHGFALIGARLEQVAGHDAAAIVYRIREHDINLFVWRVAGSDVEPVVVSTRHGYSVVTWATQGLSLAAVSDVDPQDLQRFADLVRMPAR
jgi:anti-sigma factor RsiW